MKFDKSREENGIARNKVSLKKLVGKELETWIYVEVRFNKVGEENSQRNM